VLEDHFAVLDAGVVQHAGLRLFSLRVRGLPLRQRKTGNGRRRARDERPSVRLTVIAIFVHAHKRYQNLRPVMTT
jgi:hypothetical protein